MFINYRTCALISHSWFKLLLNTDHTYYIRTEFFRKKPLKKRIQYICVLSFDISYIHLSPFSLLIEFSQIKLLKGKKCPEKLTFSISKIRKIFCQFSHFFKTSLKLMVSNDDLDGNATHLSCFYQHINSEQKYPEPAIVIRVVMRRVH